MLKEKSLVQNFIFNLIKTLNSILFPVITFAYSARVLGVDGVGKVNFAKSVITYFTMIALLGMNYYGTREASKLRNEQEKLSKLCVEMMIINGCTTVLAYILLLLAMILIPILRRYNILLWICSIAIVLQGMGMEWLYQAMEEYRYIAVRSGIFQVCAIVALFVFVREEDDVIPYAIITVLASSGSYILNFFGVRKYIRMHCHMHLEIIKHLKSLLWLFAMAVSIELYTVLDTTMLGCIKGDEAVGLYSAAIKVNKMVNTVITSVGVVLIPRLSFYLGQGKSEKTIKLIAKGYNYVFMFSIPMAVGLFALSDDIILLLSGNHFASAGFTMRILTPIVVFIPFSVMTNQQIFVPMGKEKQILISTFVGAIVNITLNSIFIPLWAENGAALATVIAEMAVALVCFINANYQFRVKIFFQYYYQYWMAAILILPISWVIHGVSLRLFFKISAVMLISGIEYVLLLRVMKNPYLVEIWHRVSYKARKGSI